MSDDMNIETPVNKRLGNKRKAVKVTREMVAPVASVEPMSIENMVLKADGAAKSHFKRLKYKGCPKLSKRGRLEEPTRFIDMKRDAFVREMYRVLKPDFNRTKKKHFDNICIYIGWLDNEPNIVVEGDYFANNLVKLYMEQYGIWVSQNKYSKGSWSIAKGSISAVLKLLNRNADAKRLPPVKGVSKGAKSSKTLHVESELKPTAKALFRGYKGFSKHIANGTTPDINPLWDETLFNIQAEACGWSKKQKSDKACVFKKNVNGIGDWRNQLSRIAAMICFMFTGMNTTPLLKMKRKDVVFKQIQGGKYVLVGEKDRANYLEIDNGIGFSKYAREFIESWLSSSARITGSDDDAYLFPFITIEGDFISFIQSTNSPQTAVNNLLEKLGLTPITPSILRKTKLDTLMKVTEDIYLVSLAANNSLSTIKKSYSSGSEQDHARNLSASMEATMSVAKGVPILDAVSTAKQNYHDVLSEYDYKRLREKENKSKDALTPLGVRCQDNKKGAANLIDKMLKKNGIEMPKEEKRCTDFLGCFECEYHKLVAATDDIWLMLSFKDTLQEMKQYPSVNSLPQSSYENICLTIDSALERLKVVSEKNYAEALEKKKVASHPLYSTIYSLNDLLEIFS